MCAAAEGPLAVVKDDPGRRCRPERAREPLSNDVRSTWPRSANQAAAMDLLLRAGGSTSLRDGEGRTALMCAAENASADARPSPPAVVQRERQERSPPCATKNASLRMVKLLLAGRCRPPREGPGRHERSLARVGQQEGAGDREAPRERRRARRRHEGGILTPVGRGGSGCRWLSKQTTRERRARMGRPKEREYVTMNCGNCYRSQAGGARGAVLHCPGVETRRTSARRAPGNRKGEGTPRRRRRARRAACGRRCMAGCVVNRAIPASRETTRIAWPS